MASIHLQGTLVDSLGEIDVGAVITFTHETTTGETLPTTKVDLVIPPNGFYSIDVEYGQIRIDYMTRFTERFIGRVTVNQNTVATSLPELLSASVPVSDPIILEMEAIAADAVAAAVTSEAFADQLTTTDLIGSVAIFSPDTNFRTKGYLTSGDGGAGHWVQNGVTAQPVSQSPAQLADALLNDGNGNQWALVGISATAKLELNVLALGAKYDNLTDDTATHTAGLNALSLAGGGVLLLASGTTRANIVNTFDKVDIIGGGRSTIIAPTSGVCFSVSGIQSGFGGHIHNFTLSGANGATTGLFVDGFSRGKFGDLWLTDGLDYGIDIDGDGSTEFTFENVYIHNPLVRGIRYSRTDGVDTGGVYFDTLHITGPSASAKGIEVTSSHTSRTRAFMFMNKVVLDNFQEEAMLLENVESFFISQMWATGTASGFGMLTVKDVKDCFIEQAWLQNSNAGGYNLLISGGGTSLETADLSIGQLRTSGPGTSMQFNGSPALTRCDIAQWNDTASTKTNDPVKLSQMRSLTLEGNLTIENKVNFGGAFATLTLNSGGEVTASSSSHRIAPETGTVDDMHTINGGTQGDRLTIMSNSGANTITVKHGTGNIYLDGSTDKTLDSSRDKLELVFFNGEWQQTSFSSNS